MKFLVMVNNISALIRHKKKQKKK